MGGLDGTVVGENGSHILWCWLLVVAGDLGCEEVAGGTGVGDDGCL